MNRRTLLKGAVVAASTPAAIAVAASEIETLYRQWAAFREMPNDRWDHMTRDEEEAELARYFDIRDRLVGAEPKTARDLAMQYHADCDGGDSTNSSEFMAKIAALIA